MRVAVLSDFHFGYGYNTELENDSFENAAEAMNKALESDIILVAGDLFDTKFPKTPVWSKAINILVEPIVSENNGVSFVNCSKSLKRVSERVINQKPVIAIHGNHEFRGKTINTLETLENAGILIYLHKDSVIFEKNGFRIAIHGMSWVPDRYAKTELENWNPKPIPDCVNILVLHQSISPFLYSPLEKPSIDVTNLPEGFDVIIDGHLHGAGMEMSAGCPILFPGSTVITQFDRSESRSEKGFYDIEIIHTQTGKPDIEFRFRPITSSRKFFFEDIMTAGGLAKNVDERLNEILALGHLKKPLIKFKIKGNENEYNERDIKEIEKRYSNDAILRFVKELESPEMTEKIEFLRNMRERKLSSEEIGLNLLHNNLDDLKFGSAFNVDDTFSLLVEDRVEEALGRLLGGFIDN